METGILVEPGNIEELSKTITTLLGDDDLGREMAEKALRYAKTFSWETTAMAFYEALRKCTG